MCWCICREKRRRGCMSGYPEVSRTLREAERRSSKCCSTSAALEVEGGFEAEIKDLYRLGRVAMNSPEAGLLRAALLCFSPSPSTHQGSRAVVRIRPHGKWPVTQGRMTKAARRRWYR